MRFFNSLPMLSLAMFLHLALAMTVTAEENPPSSERSEAVRDRLTRHGANWYDKTKDDWQRVGVPEPKTPQNNNISVDGGGVTLVKVFMYLMAIVIICLLVALIFWVVSRLRIDRALDADSAQKRGKVRQQADLSNLPFETAAEDANSDPDEALQKALAAGDWTKVVIWAYACQLFLLDHHGRIRLMRGKTNHAYLRDLKQDPLAKVLRQTIARFEATFFGRIPCAEPEARALVTAYEAMQRKLEPR